MDLKSKDTTENNILIAKFMGREIHTDGISCFDENFTPLKYNDWNTLIPVVEKIESLGFEFMITESRCAINKNTDHSTKEVYHLEVLYSKKTSVYLSVLEFIKWYNKKQ